MGDNSNLPNVWAAQRRAVCGPSAAAAGWVVRHSQSISQTNDLSPRTRRGPNVRLAENQHRSEARIDDLHLDIEGIARKPQIVKDHIPKEAMKALRDAIDTDSTGRQKILSHRSNVDLRRNVDLDHRHSSETAPRSSTQRFGRSAARRLRRVGCCGLLGCLRIGTARSEQPRAPGNILCSCRPVELTTVGATPSPEHLHVNIDAPQAVASGRHVPEPALSSREPLLIGGGELVAVAGQRAESLPLALAVPRNTNKSVNTHSDQPNVWAAQRRAVCGPSAAAAGWVVRHSQSISQTNDLSPRTRRGPNVRLAENQHRSEARIDDLHLDIEGIARKPQIVKDHIPKEAMKALRDAIDTDSTGRQKILSHRSNVDLRRNVDLDHRHSSETAPRSSTQRFGRSAARRLRRVGCCGLLGSLLGMPRRWPPTCWPSHHEAEPPDDGPDAASASLGLLPSLSGADRRRSTTTAPR